MTVSYTLCAIVILKDSVKIKSNIVNMHNQAMHRVNVTMRKLYSPISGFIFLAVLYNSDLIPYFTLDYF